MNGASTHLSAESRLHHCIVGRWHIGLQKKWQPQPSGRNYFSGLVFAEASAVSLRNNSIVALGASNSASSRGLRPNRSFTVKSAPLAARYSIISATPKRVALCNGLPPPMRSSFTLPPNSSTIIFTASNLRLATVNITGPTPSGLRAFGSAPSAIRARIISTLPLSQAVKNGVRPELRKAACGPVIFSVRAFRSAPWAIKSFTKPSFPCRTASCNGVPPFLSRELASAP